MFPNSKLLKLGKKFLNIASVLQICTFFDKETASSKFIYCGFVPTFPIMLPRLRNPFSEMLQA